MTAIGIAVIGCGDIARARYFPAIDKAPEFELRGVHNRTTSVGDAIVSRYRGTNYARLEDLFSAPYIDAVVISTPHPSHADLAVLSLDAGKHVLCEKPMATSVADAMRIEDAAAQSGHVFMALPFDWSPAVEEAKRLIEANAIGRVSMADAVLAHRGPKHAPWFFDAKRAQWGVLADLGVYLISQLTYLFGPATAVRGKVDTIFPERRDDAGGVINATVDDNAVAILELPDGVLGTIRANWCSPSDHRNVICQTRIHGANGMIFINLASKTDRVVVFSPEREVSNATPIEHSGMTNCYRPALKSYNDDLEIMRVFAEQIRAKRGGKTGGNLSRQRHVIEIIDKIYASSASGTAQPIAAR